MISIEGGAITATADDYRDWVISVLERKAEATLKAAHKVKSEFAKAGQTNGSGVQLYVAEAARDGFDQAIDVALGQLTRVARRSKIDRALLREITEQVLRAHLAFLHDKLRIKPSGVRGEVRILEERLTGLSTRLDRALHQFDVGLMEVTEPQVPISMTNTMHIGSVVGSAIQQGSPGATQSAQIAMGDVNLALAELEAVLAKLSLEVSDRASVEADIATIKAQLAKPSPSRLILAEAGQSIRSIVENITASAFTDPVLHALSNFGKSIGLS